MALGRAVKATYEVMGWTQIRLADATGIRQGRISAICSNYRGEQPTYDEIRAIESALGLPLGYFYGFVGLATAEGAQRGAEAAARLDR